MVMWVWRRRKMRFGVDTSRMDVARFLDGFRLEEDHPTMLSLMRLLEDRERELVDSIAPGQSDAVRRDLACFLCEVGEIRERMLEARRKAGGRNQESGVRGQGKR
jgi:hypothetical protein